MNIGLDKLYIWKVFLIMNIKFKIYTRLLTWHIIFHFFLDNQIDIYDSYQLKIAYASFNV